MIIDYSSNRLPGYIHCLFLQMDLAISVKQLKAEVAILKLGNHSLESCSLAVYTRKNLGRSFYIDVGKKPMILKTY